MLSIFKTFLKEDMCILSMTENSSKYKIKLVYQRMVASCELPKMCTPGDEEYYCKQAIANAVSTMYINAGDFKEAKAWLHGKRW